MKHLLFLPFLLLPVLALGLDEHGHDHGTGVAVPGDPNIVSGGAMATAVTAPVVVLTPTPTATPNLARAPRIFVARPKHDFGNVDEGPDIVHNFIVHNKGKSPLKITNVGTSCGCTAAVMGSDKYPVSAEEKAQGVQAIIPPGGHEAIKATYHTSGRPGHATKIITVSSNDPVNPGFQLQLDMTVTRDVDVSPDRLYFYNVRYKTPHSASVKVLGKPGVRLKILSADTASKVVTITSMTPITEAASPSSSPTPPVLSPKDTRYGVNLEVSLSEGQTIGAFTDEVILKTNNKKKPEVRISVIGEVVGRVQLNPKALYFAPKQDAPVTIQLTIDPPSGFAIRKVESLKHLVRPYIKKTTSANGVDQYQLIASVVKDLPKDSDGKDQVVIETNDKDQPAITIDVQAAK